MIGYPVFLYADRFPNNAQVQCSGVVCAHV